MCLRGKEVSEFLYQRDELRGIPGGKYTRAGERVEDAHPLPHRLPAVIALLIAAVSSVEPVT